MLYFILSLFFINNLFGVTIKYDMHSQSNQHFNIMVNFDLEPQEVLLKDSLKLSADHPGIQISSWQTQKESVPFFNKITHETIQVFQKDLNISFSVDLIKNIFHENPHIYLSYQTDKMNTAEFYPIKLPLKITSSKQVSCEKNMQDEFIISKKATHTKNFFSAKLLCYYQRLEDFLRQSSSLPLQLILSFFLGLLLSLTPCIYPMIPITVGILQSQKKKTFFSNFIRALFYTLGLSTTFATLGLLASYTGPLYGKLLSHPLFVVCIVVFLIYLALTMLGICDLYIPRFFNNSWHSSTHSSLISAFLFGAASGTFASPCVSPGLILLLSIVATLNNILLGFLLLFCFGVGLSTPLLIVGTFSASLNLLPQAGMWMIEVKKIFGFMLIGAAFYYVSSIINICILLSLLAVTMTLFGIWYAHQARMAMGTGLKKYQLAMATLLWISAGFVAVQAYWQTMCPIIKSNNKDIWLVDFDQAFKQAREHGKPVFIDIYADYCSICTLIDKNILSKPEVSVALERCTVPLKINASDITNTSYTQATAHYKIIGYPTFLLVDAHNYAIIKQWHSELYSTAIENFIHDIERVFCKK